MRSVSGRCVHCRPGKGEWNRTRHEPTLGGSGEAEHHFRASNVPGLKAHPARHLVVAVHTPRFLGVCRRFNFVMCGFSLAVCRHRDHRASGVYGPPEAAASSRAAPWVWPFRGWLRTTHQCSCRLSSHHRAAPPFLWLQISALPEV